MGKLKTKKVIFILSLVFLCNYAFSEESSEVSFIKKDIVSFDLGSLVIGLKNYGIGAGVNYERLLTEFLSMKLQLSYMIMNPKNLIYDINEISCSIEPRYYPFNKGLDKLYLGTGFVYDFIVYDYDDGAKLTDYVIALYPLVGWKQSLFNLCMLDFYLGYSFIVNNPMEQSLRADLINVGFMGGVRVSVNFSKIFDILGFYKTQKIEHPSREIIEIVD